MAHMIDTSVVANGAAIYAYHPAWHGLGNVLDHAFTAEEALAQGGIDFTVELVKIQTVEGTEIPEQFATVRRDTGAPLGIVGNKYQVYQNRQAFEAMSHVCHERDLLYESAGVLRGGRTVWLLARKPEELVLNKEDVIKRYIMMSTSHDGTSKVRLLPCDERVVCWNTYRIALSEGGISFAFSHTSSIEDRIEQAAAAFERADQEFERFEEIANVLLDTKMKVTDTTEIFRLALVDVFGEPKATPQEGNIFKITDEKSRKERRREDAFAQLVMNLKHPTNLVGGMKGTAWAVANAISEWTDHQQRYRGAERIKMENRFRDVLRGEMHRVKQASIERLLKLAA